MAEVNPADPQSVADHEHQAWQSVALLYKDNAAFITSLSGQCELILEVSRINNESVVLDVGCGPGLLTAQLANSVGRVVGIDFSSNMISEANSGFPELEFHEADAEKIPFADHTFDCVAMNYCAHHLARPEVALEELHRVTRPGGQIVIVHPIQSRQTSWGSFFTALINELPPETSPSGPLINVEDPDDYISLLYACGFKSPRCETRVKPARVDSVNQLLNAAWAITGLDDQPEDVQARIQVATVNNASKYLQPDGSFVFPDEVLLAWADC